MKLDTTTKQKLLDYLIENQQNGTAFLDIAEYAKESGMTEKAIKAAIEELMDSTTNFMENGKLYTITLIVSASITEGIARLTLNPVLHKPTPTEAGYTLKQAAEYLDVAFRTVNAYLAAGLLEGKKVKSKWFVTQESLDRIKSDGVPQGYRKKS